MEADVSGPQRKVIAWSVRPQRPAHGTEGIAVRNGVTLPFVVSRSWNAPLGYYGEQWFLIDPKTREVLYEGHVREVLIRGLQTWTELADDVTTPFPLQPGTYALVFALGGLVGGEHEVTAMEAPAEEAA